MDIGVYVVFHSISDINMVKKNDLYIPLLVGCNGKDNYGYISDDTGDNISYKNKYYSELTGLYWMCHNSPYDIVGLVHYRRYFAKHPFGRLLNADDISHYLENHDLIVPKRTKRINYSTYDTFSQKPLVKELLDESKIYINNYLPEYMESWNNVMDGYETSFFNMFIGSKELMASYCKWIFPILDYLLDTVDISSDQRILGMLSELLFNVWIDYNDLSVKESPLKFYGMKFNIKHYIMNISILRKIYGFIK